MLLALSECLEPGDRFVDVGANIGMITLQAARLVGPSGRVESFEPNPNCFATLERHLAINGIENVVAHRVGLSDTSGSARGQESAR